MLLMLYTVQNVGVLDGLLKFAENINLETCNYENPLQI